MTDTELQKLDGNSWRERLFSLLNALSDACKSADIPLFLYGNTALAAYRNGTLCDNPEVCIDVRDADRFERAIEQLCLTKGVCCESMLTTPCFPGFEYRVADENSIDFSVETVYCYRCCGLAIPVRLILHVPDDSKQAERCKELLAAYERYADRYRRTGKTAPHPRFTKRIGIASLSPKVASSTTFNQLKKRYSGQTKRVMVNGKTMPASVFDTSRTVAINDVEFDIPEDVETYFAAIFGKKWKTRKIRSYKETGRRFRDASHAWADFAPTIDHIDFREVASDQAAYTKLSEQFKVPHSAIAPYVGYLERTHYYFTLQTEYRGRNEELKAYLADEDFDQLEQELKSYLDKLEKCRENGLGLNFDDEIFSLALALFRNTGRDEYADELESIADQELHKTTKLGQQN